MAIRIITGQFEVTAGASSTEFTDNITNLNLLIPEAGFITPVGISFFTPKDGNGSLDDVYCERMILASEIDPEVRYQVLRTPAADAPPLGFLSGELESESGGGESLTAVDYNVEHNLQLLTTMTNDTVSGIDVGWLVKMETEMGMMGDAGMLG